MKNTSSARYTAAQGRRFALTLAAAFALLAVVASWRGREIPPLILGSLAGILLLSGILAPRTLQPVERAWMALARAISRVTTPIFMGIVYFVLLAPVGLFRRALGKNALVHKPVDDSYWIARTPSAPEMKRRRMERQF